MYEKLKSIMAEQNISANKLSMKSGISSPDIYCILNGKKPFYPNWRKRVSEALNVPEEDFFPDER